MRRASRRACPVVFAVAALVALVVTVTLVLAASAEPAAAHASLVVSDPPNGAVLDTPPTEVRVDFDEQVGVALGGISVFDAGGGRVAVGRTEAVPGTPTAARATLPALADGTYVVVWRVLSLDGHPASGAFTFSVGAAPPVDTGGLVADLLAGEGGAAAGRLQGLGRFATYAGLAGLVGGLAFLVRAWPSGLQHPGARRLVRVGWLLALAGTALGFLAQGPRVTARPLGDLLAPGLIADVAGTRLGQAHLVRLALLAAAGLLVLRPEVLTRPAGRAGGAVLGVGVALTVAGAGHAGADRLPGLGLAVGTVHVLAMAVWLGGLAMLVVAALARPGAAERVAAGQSVGAAANTAFAAGAADLAAPADGTDADLRVANRFSQLAAWAVLAVLTTGAMQVWRMVGGLGGLLDTRWGRLLVLKLVLVAALLVLAALVRRALLVRRSARLLRQRAVLELGLAVAVLGVTAVMVAAPPGSGDTPTFARTLVQGNVIADISLAPVRVGSNELHLVVSVPGGALQRVAAEARLSLPERDDLAPIPAPLDPAGPNHWVSPRLEIPYAGVWLLDLRLTTEPGRLVRLTTEVPVDQ